MIPRDPVAELWLTRPRGRSSSSLTIPVKRDDGRLAWLSVGQFLTLMWLRRRMRYSRGETTLATIAAATGTHAGAVTHRLDRLASLGLIGRHSRVGRGHRTRYWPGRPSSRRPAGASPTVNVATSTPYGGLIRAYVSRAGVSRDAARGGSPPGPPGGGTIPQRGRRRPPRLIYELCPLDGGKARLTAWRLMSTTARLVALWTGECPRCSRIIVAPLVIDLARDGEAIPTAGDILGSAPINLTGDGRPVHRWTPPAAIAPARFERLREIALEVIAGGELDEDQTGRLGARYLGWRPERIPQPAVRVVDPPDAPAARAAAWAEARDWRRVRYSQPGSGDST
jgi:hypothetical protein